MWSGSPAGPALPDPRGGDFSSSVSFSHGRHNICSVLCTSMNRNCSSPRRNKDSSDTAEGLRMLSCVCAQRNLFAAGLDQQEVFSRGFWAQANPGAEAAPFMAAQRDSAQRKMPSGKCFLVGSSLPKKVASVFSAKKIYKQKETCSTSHGPERSVTVPASERLCI